MQENIWENEYRNPKLITLSTAPAASLKDFGRFLRKDAGLEISNLSILDLGAGNGKNSLYLSLEGTHNKVFGLEISATAISKAKELNPKGIFIKQSIGMKFPFENNSMDIILDITSSNSLNESERARYLSESHRVLKANGFMFVRALSKDGDQNAKNLIKSNPGKENDTYVIPELGLEERVFSKEDFITTYSKYFEISFLERETHYTKFNNRSYKRNFWLAYLKKSEKSG